MDRRYQVFVSSTFEDLEEARREISAALLKADCFPSGMELFPAADLEQFEYIKQVIARSDYFLIVSAGKYGSIHSRTGLSYTEMEYDFAVSIGKPTIRLLHRDPFTLLPGKAIEQNDEGKKKLRSFREKLTHARLVSLWSDPRDLGQQAILALLDIRQRYPSPGWVRGENAMTVEVIRELEALRSAAKNASTDKSEKVVNFDDLKERSEVVVMIAKAEDDGGIAAGAAPINNSEIAEAIFVALISNSGTGAISEVASDILTATFSFPKRYQKYPHFWLEIPREKTEHFLHYLESRGLVRGIASAIASNWQLTQRGRLHATYISSMRNLK